MRLAFTNLRGGEMLHVARYGTENCDMWVLVHPLRRDPIGDLAAFGMIICWSDLPSNRQPGSRNVTIDETDYFEVVSEQDLPDNVLTELVKWRLMGESDDMDE